MSITPYSADVRVVNYGNPFVQDDIVVEERTEGQWQRVMAFNSLSNDYAYTEARDFARNLATQLLGQA